MTPKPPPTEPELIPYVAHQRVEASSLVLLAPHPDDEVFGCGGLLCLAAAQGVAMRVIVVTSGDAAGVAGAREQESLAAAAVIGEGGRAPQLHFWRIADRHVRPDRALAARLDAALDETSSPWLLAPSPFEVHPDHRAVCIAAIDAARRRLAQGRQVQLVFYEIGQPLLPNRTFDITAVMPRKQRAMDCFTSQLAIQRYDEHVVALNRYRSYTLGDAVRHAEAYWFADTAATRLGLQAHLAQAQHLLAQRVTQGWG